MPSTMQGWRLVGNVSRRLPRGRHQVVRLARAKGGNRELTIRDAFGLRRTVALSDEIESQLFAGVPLGLSGRALEMVPRGGWALDVGANVGVVTGQLAQLVGSTGRVHAFEPVPRNVERLRELIAENHLNVTLCVVGVGREAGTLLLRMPEPGHSGWASVTASWNTSGTLEVEQTTLDQVVFGENTGRKVDFCKIDVEGAEFDVLSGADRMLREHRPVLYVECNDPLLRDAGRSSRELIDAVTGYGYDVIPESSAAASDPDGLVLDLLFLPLA